MNSEVPIKKGRKYDQVIAGARDVFLREGFEGASVDVIARDAGVSKATLYSYFPDKQRLFAAVLHAECNLQSDTSMGIEYHEKPVPAALYEIALSFMRFMLSDGGMAIFRVCMAEAVRFPELGRTFYESGPQTAGALIAQYLQSEKAREALAIDNPHLAADHFMRLCRSDLLFRKMFGILPDPTAAEIEADAREVVKTFLARFARA